VPKKTRKFKTEVQQLLDLVIHSLYSKKEIFLRELISNASDAIDRLRFESLTDKKLISDGEDWEIRIHPDQEARTLTISDNGIGMNSEELEKNIGTIASSGTRRFLEELPSGGDTNSPDFIGQFGVGFYSAFMVADKVTLVTRRAGEDQPALRWTSAGTGNYTLEEIDEAPRGTAITLHLREEMDEYLDEWRIRQIVTHYSDYIEYPVVMTVTREKKAEKEGDEPTQSEEDQTLNSMKSIWRKSKDEVSEEDYTAFYRHISHDYAEPLRVIHFVAEGATEFRALLYLPAKPPMDLLMPDQQHGLHLYVRNVFINDNFQELLPEYLRFVKGVVDSSDLPLNVSREMLQDHAVIQRIRKSLIAKILNELSDLQKKDMKSYRDFFDNFGKIVKEGLHTDFENQDKLKELCLYHSTKSEPEHPITFRDYVTRMPASQEKIYFITGEDVKTVAESPLLELFRSKDYEVLFFLDPIDEFVAPRLGSYDGKEIVPIDRGTLDVNKEEDNEEITEQHKAATEEYKTLLTFIGDALKDDIKEVRLSKRLTDSSCCLVGDDQSIGRGLERVMRAMNQPIPPSPRILEVNAEHPVVQKMKKLLDEDPASTVVKDWASLLYGQALLAEGAPPKDPVRFARLVGELMQSSGPPDTQDTE
jgi:molecular chaperone HtpG